MISLDKLYYIIKNFVTKINIISDLYGKIRNKIILSSFVLYIDLILFLIFYFQKSLS